MLFSPRQTCRRTFTTVAPTSSSCIFIYPTGYLRISKQLDVNPDNFGLAKPLLYVRQSSGDISLGGRVLMRAAATILASSASMSMPSNGPPLLPLELQRELAMSAYVSAGCTAVSPKLSAGGDNGV
jgi:hypothetical protein